METQDKLAITAWGGSKGISKKNIFPVARKPEIE